VKLVFAGCPLGEGGDLDSQLSSLAFGARSGLAFLVEIGLQALGLPLDTRGLTPSLLELGGLFVDTPGALDMEDAELCGQVGEGGRRTP